jgi:hypothetical protein
VSGRRQLLARRSKLRRNASQRATFGGRIQRLIERLAVSQIARDRERHAAKLSSRLGEARLRGQIVTPRERSVSGMMSLSVGES